GDVRALVDERPGLAADGRGGDQGGYRNAAAAAAVVDDVDKRGRGGADVHRPRHGDLGALSDVRLHVGIDGPLDLVAPARVRAGRDDQPGGRDAALVAGADPQPSDRLT